jgi:hypothetical protein
MSLPELLWDSKSYSTRSATTRATPHMAAPLGGHGRRRLLLLAPTVMGLALAAGACGGSAPGVASLGTTTTTATGGRSSVADLVTYARCMRSHGVASFPDPAAIAEPGADIKAFKLQISKIDSSSTTFQAAQRACAKYGPPGTSPPQITTQDQADYLKAAACMRNRGIVGFPDPVFSGGQVDFPIPKGMNPNSTQFRRAREICEMLIPAGLPYSKEAESGR